MSGADVGPIVALSVPEVELLADMFRQAAADATTLRVWIDPIGHIDGAAFKVKADRTWSPPLGIEATE